MLFEKNIGMKTPIEPKVIHTLISLLLENPKGEGVYASIYLEDDELYPRYEIRNAEDDEEHFNLDNLVWM